MNGFDLSTISGLYVGSTEYTSIYKGSTLIWTKSGPTPIDYSREYFTIESLEDNNVISFKANDSSLLRTIQVSTDKTNWTSYTSSTSGTTLATLNTGQKLYVKANNNYYATSTTVYNYFTSSRTFNVYGNIMSLIYGDNFVNQTTLSEISTFCYLFRNCTSLVDISNLILPATTLTDDCYYSMFSGCTSLTAAPELPATTLTNHCYAHMFRDCTSLKAAPELPATTLNTSCYIAMFYGCTSLKAAPELPATTLNTSCYYYMFYGCTSLNYVKALFTTDISSTTAYNNNWLYKVAATGTFVKSKNATWSKTGASGIPSGWTVTTI